MMYESYKNPELHEVRLLDDEEKICVSLYETGALDKERYIGAFLIDSVAFCRVKECEDKVFKCKKLESKIRRKY